MNRISELDYDSLVRAYVFANTPTYIFKHFRRNQSVEAFAKSRSSHQLRQLFDEAIRQDLHDLENVVTVYATVIALTFKPYTKEIGRFFDRLAQREFEWSKELGQICASNSAVTDSTHAGLAAARLEDKWRVFGGESNSSNVQYKPNVEFKQSRGE